MELTKSQLLKSRQYAPHTVVLGHGGVDPPGVDLKHYLFDVGEGAVSQHGGQTQPLVMLDVKLENINDFLKKVYIVITCDAESFGDVFVI